LSRIPLAEHDNLPCRRSFAPAPADIILARGPYSCYAIWRAIGTRERTPEKDAAAMEKSSKHEAQFAKMQRATTGKKQLSDYEARAAELRTQTAKLKALRLARDAANPPPPPAAPKRRGKTKGPSGSLSDWLDGQAKEGRQS
jgi:hypothetical protein